MANDLALVEREMRSHLPIFREVLPRTLPAERLMRTVIIAAEKTPELLNCSMQSLVSSAITAAVLGLEVDGVTGQGYVLPFKGKAQFIVGYKGYPTIGARSGVSINFAVVREGDDFDYMDGTDGYIRHRKQLASRVGRKIIAAWATGEAIGRPPVRVVLPYDDILLVKERAPGAKRSDSPWNDHAGNGHEAMCAKTAVRRLGARIPVVAFQQATYIEDAQERGHTAYLRPDGAAVLDGEVIPPTGITGGSPYPERSQAIEELHVKPREQPEPTQQKTVNQQLAELRMMSKAEADKWAKDNADRLKGLAAGNPTQRDAYESIMQVISTRAP
jgi:recombination protein RecT